MGLKATIRAQPMKIQVEKEAGLKVTGKSVDNIQAKFENADAWFKLFKSEANTSIFFLKIEYQRYYNTMFAFFWSRIG